MVANYRRVLPQLRLDLRRAGLEKETRSQPGGSARARHNQCALIAGAVMDGQLQTLILQLLQQTADGLAAAVWAPIGEIETAERFQSRMDLSVQRLTVIR